MCKCCSLLKYPKCWFENAWFHGSCPTAPSPEEHLPCGSSLSVLSLSCIWCQPAAGLAAAWAWAEITELLAVVRKHSSQQIRAPAAAHKIYSACTPFFDVVLKLPRVSVSFKTEILLLGRCIKRTQAGDLCHGSSGGWMGSGKCSSLQLRLSLLVIFMGKWLGIPCRIWSTEVCTVVAQREDWTDWNRKDIKMYAQRLRIVLQTTMQLLFLTTIGFCKLFWYSAVCNLFWYSIICQPFIVNTLIPV